MPSDHIFSTSTQQLPNNLVDNTSTTCNHRIPTTSNASSYVDDIYHILIYIHISMSTIFRIDHFHAHQYRQVSTPCRHPHFPPILDSRSQSSWFWRQAELREIQITHRAQPTLLKLSKTLKHSSMLSWQRGCGLLPRIFSWWRFIFDSPNTRR